MLIQERQNPYSAVNLARLNWNKKKLLKDLREAKERNRIGNLQFIDLHVAWLKRTSNRDWSRRQKILIDEVYKRNRHLKLNHASGS